MGLFCTFDVPGCRTKGVAGCLGSIRVQRYGGEAPEVDRPLVAADRMQAHVLEAGEDVLAALAPDRLDDGVADEDGDVEDAGQRLDPARQVYRLADDGVLEPPRAA